LLAAPDRDQQERHHGRHQQRRAQVVDLDRARRRLDGQAQDGADDEQRDRPDGQVDVEDPAPGEVVDEEAAEQRPGYAGQREDRLDIVSLRVSGRPTVQSAWAQHAAP